MSQQIDADPRLRRDHGWRETREPDQSNFFTGIIGGAMLIALLGFLILGPRSDTMAPERTTMNTSASNSASADQPL